MPKGIWVRQCRGKKHPPFTPAEHQKAVVNYFINRTMVKDIYKGLLLFHRLGAGKTCSGFLTTDSLINLGKIKKIYLLTPGSLRSNWVDEYCKKCGYDPEYLKKYYTFITYNYAVGNAIDKLDFNDSVVIIDEVHNVIRGVINSFMNSNLAKRESKTAYKIYQKLKNSKCKIMALSGTPVFTHIYEWSILGNILKPGSMPDIIKYNDVDTDEFLFLFDVDKDGLVTPKNPSEFQIRLKGVISYYSGSKEDFPELIEMEPVKIKATSLQENFYWKQDMKQSMLLIPLPDELKYQNPALYEFLESQKIRAAQYQFTRAAANFYYPPEYRAIYKSKIFKPKTGKLAPGEEKEGDEEDPGKGRADALVKDDGWISKETFAYPLLPQDYSTKITAILANIVLHLKFKHVIYTFFKNKYGVKLLHALFKMCGIKSVLYSGDQTEAERKKILEKFNRIKNRNGDIIKVLLITGAGAEGISIMETNHLHVVESEPSVNNTKQVIGRVARYGSHSKLPKNRRYVKVWRYWTMANSGTYTLTYEKKNKETGKMETKTKIYENTTMVDEYLYNKGIIKTNEINSFLSLLIKASVT